MRLDGYFRFADRTHALLAPLIYFATLGAIFVLLMVSTEGGLVRAELPFAQIVGTLVTFSGLPAYLLAAVPPEQRLAAQAVEALEPIARSADVELVRDRIRHLRGGWKALLFGIAFGISQNPLFVGEMIRSGDVHPLDFGFVAGACLTWVAVGLVLCWHLPIGQALSGLGERLTLDLYRLDQLRPLSRLANTGVLLVAGALAFTPLQSLDAQFRFGNYFPAVVIGVPAAVLLFVQPLWGVRKQIMAAKQARLAQLNEIVDQVERGDIARLEAVTSHVERVRSIPNWPVDLQLITRLFAYVIIPPLAWVAAALVENFVDNL